MLAYKNLTIIGTSHIAVESIKEVTSFIKEKKPNIIALELDKPRFFSLMQQKKGSKFSLLKEMGIKVFLLNLIGAWVEKKLGKLVGVSPGSEMKKAALLAKKQNAKIMLIDQDARITLKKLTQIPAKEKYRIFSDILKSRFKKEEKIKIDLRKVPEKEFIKTILKKIEERYPTVYKVLIKERNEFMAKNLYKLITQFPEEKIVAIVGAGHEEELIHDIKKYEKN
ncbi:TraB/GumN family protein [Candidatus Woesearchaeota archaeon]|nr:TraB/GumN family protein [Candidatus Woesearchaeota archaeon]